MKKKYLKPEVQLRELFPYSQIATSGNFSFGDFDDENDGYGDWIW